MFLESWEKVLQGFILILGENVIWGCEKSLKVKKIENFDPHQMICFWKSETELEMDLLEFWRSEIIRGQKGVKSDIVELFGRIFWQNILKYGLVVFTSFSLLPRIPQRLVRPMTLEVVGGQHTFHNSWICWMCFSDDLCFVPHLYLIWGTWGTYVYKYLILRYVFHSPKETSRREWSLVPVKMSGAHQTFIL